jgi:hyperosmotically inducible protein
MKTIQNLGTAVLLAASTIVGVTGCTTGDRYHESTGEYIDDANVTRHVKSALGDDQLYKYPDVVVTTFKGSVQLSGFVNERSQKDKAGVLAKSVPGAKEVVNNITVKDAAGADAVVADGTLTSRVKDALDNDVYKYPDVKVSTYNGTVQLSGFVDGQAQKTKAGTLAKAVPGVKEVINNITVKSGE